MSRKAVGIVVGLVVAVGAILLFHGERSGPPDDAPADVRSAKQSEARARKAHESRRSWWQHSDLEPDVLDDREPENVREPDVPAVEPAERAPDDHRKAERNGGKPDLPSGGVRFPETRRVVSLGPQAADPRFGSNEDVAYESGEDSEFAADSFAEISNAGDVTAEAGSIAFWVQPKWSPDEPHDGSLIALAEGRLRVLKESDSIRFEFTNTAGANGGIGAEIFEWQPGEWHYVLGTWNGPVMTLFVDGEQVTQGIRDGDLELPERPRLGIGSTSDGEVSPPPGVIKDIRIYKRAIGPEEVSTHFRQLAAQPAPAGAKD